MSEQIKEEEKGLYSNPNINKEIIEAAAKRDLEIINAVATNDIALIDKQEETQKTIRGERRSDESDERKRKKNEENDARERAKTVWTEMQTESKCCCLKSPFICKKIILLILVALEIMALVCWAHHPTELEFEKLIAPILLVGILFTLILLLGNTIVKDERELAKAKAEMLKEAFMRRLK